MGGSRKLGQVFDSKRPDVAAVKRRGANQFCRAAVSRPRGARVPFRAFDRGRFAALGRGRSGLLLCLQRGRVGLVALGSCRGGLNRERADTFRQCQRAKVEPGRLMCRIELSFPLPMRRVGQGRF